MAYVRVFAAGAALAGQAGGGGRGGSAPSSSLFCLLLLLLLLGGVCCCGILCLLDDGLGVLDEELQVEVLHLIKYPQHPPHHRVVIVGQSTPSPPVDADIPRTSRPCPSNDATKTLARSLFSCRASVEIFFSRSEHHQAHVVVNRVMNVVRGNPVRSCYLPVLSSMPASRSTCAFCSLLRNLSICTPSTAIV